MAVTFMMAVWVSNSWTYNPKKLRNLFFCSFSVLESPLVAFLIHTIECTATWRSSVREDLQGPTKDT